MIATRNNLPLLQDQHGGICAIDTGWLLAALDRAAIKAGFMEWWLADHVTSGVCSYLRSFYTQNVVGLGRLQEVVRQALEDIGYEEIARCFEADSPASHISLLHCVQAAGSPGRSAFFQEIASRIDELHRSHLPSFHFHDLRSCLLYFNGGQEEDHRLLSSEVIGFVREKIASLSWDRPVHSSIH